MLLSKTATIKWGSKNKKYLMDLGYKFEHFGDELEIPVEKLLHGSNAMVDIKCDYCGVIFKRCYRIYYNSHHNTKSENPRDSCAICTKKYKIIETIEELYGVDNISKIPTSAIKRKNTCLKKYGTEEYLSSDIARDKILKTNNDKYGGNSPCCDKDIIEKRKNNCLEKYGVESTNQLKEVRDKYKNTMKQKYGVEYPIQNQDIADKMKNTCIKKYGENYQDIFHERAEKAMIEKYGVKCSVENDEIKHKILETLSSNVSSKQEDEVFKILKYIYGDKVDHSVVRYDFILDYELNINDCKIDIEFDGWYWHKNSLERDRKRNYFLINRGYKVLRIRSDRILPKPQQIIECVDYLINSNHTYKELNLDI